MHNIIKLSDFCFRRLFDAKIVFFIYMTKKLTKKTKLFFFYLLFRNNKMVVDLAEWLGNKQEKMKCVLEKKKNI